MFQHPSWRRHAAALLTMASSCLAAPVQAQTYTYKELIKPASTTSCWVAAMLNTQGDVAGTCTQVGGYSLGVPNGSGGIALALVPWTFNKPVVWRAGGAPTVLSMPSKTTADSAIVILDNGDVMGGTTKYTYRGALTGPRQGTLWHSNTRTASPPLPAGYEGTFSLASIRSSGTMLLAKYAYTSDGYSAGKLPTLAVTVKGQTQTLPPVPTSQDWNVNGMAVNDLGQVAISGWVSGGAASTEGWFWDGLVWQFMTLPTTEDIFTLNAVSNLGQVTGIVRGYNRFVWSPSSAAMLSAARADQPSGSGTVAAINDQGRIVSSVADNTIAAANGRRAVMWINEQFVDLNSRVTLPANWVLTEALAINAKGQVLARAEDTSKTGAARLKSLVLSPK